MSETAERITAPTGQVIIGGKTYPVRYDHAQIRETELAWMALARVGMGYLGILSQATRDMYTALLALVYGAIASGQAHAGVAARERLTLAQMEHDADYMTLHALRGEAVEMAARALGEPDEKKTA